MEYGRMVTGLNGYDFLDYNGKQICIVENIIIYRKINMKVSVSAKSQPKRLQLRTLEGQE